MQDIESILNRYLMGEAKPAEAELVENWIAASPANKVEFDRQWKLLEQFAETGFPVTDVFAEWKAFSAKAAVKKILLKGSGSYHWLFKLLSVLIVGGVVLTVLYKTFQSEAPSGIIQRTTDQPQNDTLSNGVVLMLDVNSSISYPDKNSSGPVEINGNVFVKYSDSGAAPLLLKAGALDIELIQGAMQVQYDSTGKNTTLQVQQGKAFVKVDDKILELHSGQAIFYDERTPGFSAIKPVDINGFGYATKVFRFDRTPLKEAVKLLEKTYRVRIVLSDPELGERRINALLENESFTTVIEIIAMALELTYHYNGDAQVKLSEKDRE